MMIKLFKRNTFIGFTVIAVALAFSALMFSTSSAFAQEKASSVAATPTVTSQSSANVQSKQVSASVSKVTTATPTTPQSVSAGSDAKERAAGDDTSSSAVPKSVSSQGATQTSKSSAKTVSSAKAVKTASQEKKSIAKAKVSGYKKNYAYSGKTIKPTVTVKVSGRVLVKGKDYTIVYRGKSGKVVKNPIAKGTYSFKITGKGTYKGSVTKRYQITAASIAKATVDTYKKCYLRTGKAIIPKFRVRLHGVTLRLGTDYKVTIKNQRGSTVDAPIERGTYSFTVRGKGNYAGSVSGTYSIILPLTITESTGTSYAVGKPLWFYFNNAISKVTFSDPRIVALWNSYADGFNATASEIGTTTIRVVDIYGQAISRTINVSQTMYDRNSKKMELGTSRFDNSMIIPSIDDVRYNEYYIGLNCIGKINSDNPYGYEARLSCNKGFQGDTTKTDYATSDWNNLGFVKLSFFYPPYAADGAHYVKVRSFRLEGTTKVYGPWSPVREITIPNYTNQSSTPAKYSYQVYFLDGAGTDLYSKTNRTIFVKTDNPDSSSFDLFCDGKSVSQEIGSSGGRYTFADVDYSSITDVDALWQKVKGGYIAVIRSDIAGQKTFELREFGASGYSVARSYHWTVRDYATERDNWMRGVIGTCTTSSMTGLQKMSAVCDYLLNTLQFKYLNCHYLKESNNWGLVNVASSPNSPYFKFYRWDSQISPAALCRFAELVGFDTANIHNCYYEYSYTDPAWDSMHYKIHITVDGKEYYFAACPGIETGEVGTVKKIDFDDASRFTAA